MGAYRVSDSCFRSVYGSESCTSSREIGGQALKIPLFSDNEDSQSDCTNEAVSSPCSDSRNQQVRHSIYHGCQKHASDCEVVCSHVFQKSHRSGAG